MALPVVYLGGMCVTGVGLLLLIVGMATPDWSTMASSQFGVFRFCSGDICGDLDGDKLNSDYEAVRAMLVIGCLAGLGGVGLAGLFLLLRLLGKSTMKIFILLAAGACVGACISVIIAVIVYAAEIHDDMPDTFELGYSFVLPIVGAILLGVGGCLIFMGGKSLS